MTNVALYVRVSTNEQVEHGNSIDEQKERLINYCKAMGWQISGVYVDGGFSGSNMDRPALKKLLSELKLIDVVAIYKLDRLSRSQKDTLHIIEDKLIKNSVDIVSLQEKLDTTTAFGRAAIGILSAFAQLERETFKERSLLGRTGRARKGKWHGGTRPPIGYDYDIENQQLIINPYEAEQVKEVFNMYIQGVGLQKIATIMHKKGYKHKYGDWTWWGGVTTMLKNPVYTGKVTFNNKEFDGQHEAIVDSKTFIQVQELLATRQTGQLYKRKSPFSHLLYCAKCGTRMFMLNKTKKEPKYYCYSRYGKPIGKVLNPNCKMRIWPARLIDQTILAEIDSLITDKSKLASLLNATNIPKKSEISKLQKKVSDIEKQINKLLDLYQFNDNTNAMPAEIINERIRALHEEKTSINNMIEKISQTQGSEKNIMQAIKEKAKEVRDNWNDLEIQQQVELINALISKVVVSDDNIDIYWAFGHSDGE